MRKRYLPNISFSILLIFLTSSVALSDVTLEPFGVAVSLEADAEEAVEMSLINDGEIDVSYRISLAAPPEEEQRRGPRRDDLGDRIEYYEYRQAGWCGIAWAGEEMCVANYDRQRVHFWNIEEEDFVHDFGTQNYFPWGVAYDGDAYWISSDNALIHVDRDGEVLSQINPGFGPSGVAWDGENLWTHPYGGNGRMRRLTVEGDVLTTINCQNIRGANCYALTWVPEHDNGHMWVITEAGWLMQLNLNIDDEEVEVIQEHNLQNAQGIYGITHDSENIWWTIYSARDNQELGWVVTDDGIEEPRWLIVDPREGVIEADDRGTFELQFFSAGIEDGLYEMRVLIELAEVEERDDLSETLIEIYAVMSIETAVASVSGTVTDATQGDPVPDTRIEIDRYLISRETGDEGEYEFVNLPLGDYEFTFTAEDFLPHSEEVSIEEAGEIELNVRLLHAQCTPSEERFIADLEMDGEYVFEFNISNGGNGPLTYSIERRLTEVDAEPWDLRFSMNVEDLVNDNQLNGVVFVEDHYYISGGNRGDAVNKIYVLNREGEQVDEFNQFIETRYGMRDLAYDGELIWGADDDENGDEILYGFDIECDLVHTIAGEAGSYRSLTWDEDRNIFWSANITSDIYATDPEGNLVETIDAIEDARIYGLAYWRDDPDGYNLYVLTSDETNDRAVYKIDVENEESMFVTALELEGDGRFGGAFVTNRFDIYSWAIVVLVQNPDRLAVWQLDSNFDWFQVEPEAGVIEADGGEDFTLTLNSADLPPEDFEGELVITHDGIGGETVLQVTLRVVEGEVPTSRELNLHTGWNTVSANLRPENEDVEVIMADLVEADLLIMMKNGAGEFYRPDFDFNNIPGWFVNEGYQIKMSAAAMLTVEGVSVFGDEPIELHEGWQLISYYPRNPVDARLALSGISDNLRIAKDGYGNFYLPQWDFSNIGEMREGQGYYMNVDQQIDLVYVTHEEEEAAMAGTDNARLSVYSQPGELPVHAVTGWNMSLLVLSEPPLSPPLLRRGGEIGVYASDKLVGSGVIRDGVCGIAVWGDDPTTEEIDGALEGEALEIRLLSGGKLLEAETKILSGELVYSTDELSVVELIPCAEIPSEFGIISAYPNPFNSLTRITYQLPEAGEVKLRVFDVSGRQVSDLIRVQQPAGVHSNVLDGRQLASGVYMVRLEACGNTSQVKVMLVK